jgi:DNA-binding PadR family transcriptional regulator
MHDKVDAILLGLCYEKPGQQLRELISTFQKTGHDNGIPDLSDRSLRDRLNSLEKDGLLELDRESVKRRVFCYPTKEGKNYLNQDGRFTHPKAGDSQ